MTTSPAQMTDSDLNAEYDALDGHECTLENDCADCRRILAVERELDARYDWNHEDARVRESVGNYR